MTDRLVNRVRALQAEKGDNSLMLRLSVDGGGCQGFEYRFGFSSAKEEGDTVFEKDGVSLVVDEASLPLLAGAEVDFIDELAGASFQVRNPNAQSTCGCGTSFSVKD